MSRQNINQQTCDPNEIEVKSPQTPGRQLSIKDISSVTPEPTRGWDESGATTKIMFVQASVGFEGGTASGICVA